MVPVRLARMGKLWPLWAFLLGVGLALTLPPFPTGFLAPLAIAGLLALFKQKPRFWAGFAAGCGLFALHLAWLPLSFTQNFGSWGWVPFLPLILLEAIPLGLLAGLLGKKPLALIGAWVLLDWVRSLGEFSFPWGYPGYALVDSPGRILAALGGIWLCSLVVLGTGYALANKRWAWAVPWVLLWVLPLPPANPQQTALLIQGNIDPLKKVYGSEDLDAYHSLSVEAIRQHPEANLVIWPETAVGEVPQETLELLGDRKLIAGLYGQNQNRAVLFTGERTWQYAKVRLVPFGEFFPARGILQPVYSFFFQSFGLPELQDIRPGKGFELLAEHGTYICYEGAYPQIARTMTKAGAAMLINISNDAWFGTTFGARQHFQMGRMRAVENGRWLLRAGNSGITAAIDPYGRIVAELPAHQAGFLAAPYSLSTRTTPFSWIGEWILLLALLLIALGLRAQTSPGSLDKPRP